MKKKLFAILIIATLSLSIALPAIAARFSDTAGHWAEEYIDAAASFNLINGDGDGNFRPDENITRAEFLKVLSVCLEKNIDMGNKDGLNHWVAPYYNYAVTNYLKPNTEEKIVSSNGAAYYVSPGVIDEATADYPIERWEMAYLVWEGVDNYLKADENLTLSFNDKDEIINTYPKSVQIALSNAAYPGLYLFQGDENNNFNAGAYATRAEAAALLTRANDFFNFAEGVRKELENAKQNESDNPAAPTTNPEDFTATDKNEEQNPDSTDTNKSENSDNTNTPNQEKENQNMAEHSFATVTMENGDTFKIELMPEYAPETVANFIELAESGFYDGLTFHRVVEGFMAQGGDPEGTGMGGSKKTIKGEFSSNGFTQNTLSHTRGVISMARSQNPDSASSQFFICYDDASFLDGEYAAFGKVTEGMETVDAFLKVERKANSMGEAATPVTPIVIKSITIEK